jgi:hypothetical protein
MRLYSIWIDGRTCYEDWNALATIRCLYRIDSSGTGGIYHIHTLGVL